ncbi:hypothetical protein JM79_2772 [Gramella sp. Hel_I_59]|uniref:hypothetical protein n=1 Tax=Gramella sp. Hel_I_59 TaxID=1249978 RepID=UPI00114FAF97|nr:hypothetical protein [Gramella sp. Hel_I_59]TQI71823.1 hypothetical protein JM79_2772 [Gramella sp. Hel_I_59]
MQPDPTHAQLVNYFKNINAQLNDFPENSFFRQDLEEIFGAFRSGIKFPCLAVESPEIDGQDSTEQNTVIGRMFAFVVYMNPRKGNFDQQNEYLDQCERIAKKILSRMRYDSNIPGNILYRKFKVSTVKGVMVGPVYTEHLYGYRFAGMISGNESLKVDPADWKDLDSVC